MIKRIKILILAIFINTMPSASLAELFYEEKTDYSVPIELRMYEDASKSQRQFTDTHLDPWLKDTFGYESSRTKIKSITANVDFGNGRDVQKAYQAIQAIDSQEALAWLKSMRPFLKKSGSCPCPYNVASDGSVCGGRSAYSRSGGYEPVCYESDIK